MLSGNDACVTVAEGLAATEKAFAQQMNARAKALGLTNSTFVNSSGWPEPNHLMSVRDLGLLSARLIEEFPEYYHYFAIEEFAWDGRAPQNRFNRNPLLGLGIGVDGLKTGHTNAAGYGLAGSAQRGERRIVFVLSGLDSEEQRADESERLVNWAFRQFALKTVLKKNAPVADALVWMGDMERVGLIATEDVSILIPALQQDGVPAEVIYNGPLQAPLARGDAVGELVIRIDGMPETRVELVADRDVPLGGILRRLSAAASSITYRIIGFAYPQGTL